MTIVNSINSLHLLQNSRDISLLYQGKVRDVYIYPPLDLIMVSTDRVSIYDFVLNTSIPYKGEVLTAFTHFWVNLLLTHFKDFLSDFIPSSENSKFNAIHDIQPELARLPLKNSLVVRNLTGRLDPFELIFRYHLGGSIFTTYKETGFVAGKKIGNNDLKEWSYLEQPLFSPSTKEKNTHDINVTPAEYYNKTSVQGEYFIPFLKEMYKFAYSYAKTRGLLILDTKFEASSTLCMVADELFTPDCSRYVEISNWEKYMRGEEKVLRFFDKQILRNWGKKLLANRNPNNPEDKKFVSEIEVPDEIRFTITDNYLTLFKILTGQSLFEYQKNEMGFNN